MLPYQYYNENEANCTADDLSFGNLTFIFDTNIHQCHSAKLDTGWHGLYEIQYS